MDGEAEATRQCQEPLVTEIGPRRRHGIVIVDRSFGHEQAPGGDGRNAQIGFPDEWVVGEILGRPVEHDASGIHDEGMVRKLQRRDHVLLDQQDGQPGCVDLGQRDAELLDDARRQAERELVDHQQARRGHQAAGDRAHLLLAAGQGRCILIAPLVEPGEQAEHEIEIAADGRAAVAPRDRPPSADCRGRSSRRTAGALPARGRFRPRRSGPGSGRTCRRRRMSRGPRSAPAGRRWCATACSCRHRWSRSATRSVPARPRGRRPTGPARRRSRRRGSRRESRLMTTRLRIGRRTSSRDRLRSPGDRA